MLEFLRHTDRSLFHSINGEWANGFFDILFPILRSDAFLLVCYIVLAIVVYRWYPRLFFKTIIFGALTIVLTDQLASHVIKPYIHRIRPCNNIVMEARLIVKHCGSGWSFVSSHAANVFGLATFGVMLAREKSKTVAVLYIWAALVCYAQVYVGVHFPGDVVMGALLGITIGVITGGLCQYFVIKPALIKSKI